jgi:hypothetical protein
LCYFLAYITFQAFKICVLKTGFSSALGGGFSFVSRTAVFILGGWDIYFTVD